MSCPVINLKVHDKQLQRLWSFIIEITTNTKFGNKLIVIALTNIIIVILNYYEAFNNIIYIFITSILAFFTFKSVLFNHGEIIDTK